MADAFGDKTTALNQIWRTDFARAPSGMASTNESLSFNFENSSAVPFELATDKNAEVGLTIVLKTRVSHCDDGTKQCRRSGTLPPSMPRPTTFQSRTPPRPPLRIGLMVPEWPATDPANRRILVLRRDNIRRILGYWTSIDVSAPSVRIEPLMSNRPNAMWRTRSSPMT